MSPLFSMLCSDIGWSLVADTSSDGEGVKTDWLILVSKAGATVSCSP